MGDLKRVTLYRIKPGFGFDDFLKGDLATYDHFEKPEHEYEAYVKFVNAGGGEKTDAGIPWLKFLNSEFEPARYTFSAFNRFPRAIMALKVRVGDEDIYFASTFGQHGDALLEKSCIVYDFGIKVGMNICDIDKLRRIQTTAHEAISKQTERQASVGTNLGVFGINTEAEFLRTISANVRAEFAGVVESFKGRDSISIKLPRDATLSWGDMVDICRRLEDRYTSDDYKTTEFKVYDILRHEHDPAVIEQLDELLCAKISSKNFDKIHLAPPEFVEIEDLSYCYRGMNEDGDEDDNVVALYDDLVISDLVGQPRRRLKDLTSQTIRSWKIYRYDPDQEKTFPMWNAYQCLVAEIQHGSRTFVLSNGQWREVSEELKERVQRYFELNDLTMQLDYLPNDIRIYDEEKNQDREELYNSHVALNAPAAFLFDKAKVDIAGKRIYEICDIMHSDRHFVHVKRYTSGAASISHIFTQTKLYSEAFATDDATRASILAWIEGSELPANDGKDKNIFKAFIPENSRDVNEREFLIVFCVLHSSNEFNINDLPFMAQYELMLTHRYLTQNRKFNVGLVFRRVLLGPEAAEAA